MFDRTDQNRLASQGVSHSSIEIPSVDCDRLGLSDRSTKRKRSRIGLGTPKLLGIFAAATLALLMSSTQALIINCATNCKTCWGSGSAQCMTCDDGYFM